MSGYHFHKDCKYYYECTQELIKKDGHELIKLVCPKGGVTWYYKSDINAVKWDSPCFEPYQTNITDYIKGEEVRI